MPERITKSAVVVRAQNVTQRLQASGRGVAVEWRNGYCALDEYQGSTCLRTITVGTTREVAEFLHAMMVGIDLSRSEDWRVQG